MFIEIVIWQNKNEHGRIFVLYQSYYLSLIVIEGLHIVSLSVLML